MSNREVPEPHREDVAATSMSEKSQFQNLTRPNVQRVF